MGTEVLVDSRLEEGQRLIAELIVAGIDVSVAFWIKTADDGLWYLYVGSKSAEADELGNAYRSLYQCLARIPDLSWGLTQVKMIAASSPMAQDAIEKRERRIRRYQGGYIGSILVDEAYIYPPVGGQMNSMEILQTLIALSNQPASVPPAPFKIKLSNGKTQNLIITGFNLQLPGQLVIHTKDPVTNNVEQINGNEVFSIYR